MRFNHAHLLLADHRADFCGGIHAVSNAQFACFGSAGVDELRIKPFMHVTTLDGKAGLAGVHEGSPDGGTRSHVDVCIFEDEHRIFAAEFEHNWQQTLGAGLSNPAACSDTSRKYQLVDLAFYKCGTGRAVAG